MLLLFDIDGTLVSSDGAGRRAFDAACFELLQIEGALDGIKLDGMTDPVLLHMVYERHYGRAPSDHESRAVLERYVMLLAPEVQKSKYVVHEGVPEAMQLAARGHVLGLATGNLREGARIKLERCDLWKHFAFGGFSSDASERSEIVRTAIARGRAAGGDGEVWVIGDTPRDVAAAHAAGARALGVATGSYSVEDLQGCGADLAVPTLRSWLATL
jgi:phosphoglycolate phosphatase-like HAD superfamily hydrolase